MLQNNSYLIIKMSYNVLDTEKKIWLRKEKITLMILIDFGLMLINATERYINKNN